MSSTLSLTTQDILNDRATRKAMGLVGCITGQPVSNRIVFGFSDVQSWRPSDPMNPHCFCFDCRGLWDRDATIDLQLVQNGHEYACYAYRNLIPNYVMPRRSAPSVDIPQSNHESFEDVPDSLPAPRAASRPSSTGTLVASPEIPSLQRSDGGGIRSGSDDPSSTGTLVASPEIPPLPQPVPRDVMNETPLERLRRDLKELRAHIYADLIPVMDRRRNGACMGEPELSSFLHQVDVEEGYLHAKLKAIEVLLDE